MWAKKIQFERTGGFGGLRTAVTVDLSALPPEQAQQIQDLIESSTFFDLPSSPPMLGTGADQFYYRLTIAGQDREHSIETTDTAAPEGLRPLLRELTLLARQSGR